MAYKNLNADSQKWSYSLAVACAQTPLSSEKIGAGS